MSDMDADTEPHYNEKWDIVHGSNWEYVEDVDHDRGSCAIYKHKISGKYKHIELPD